MYAPETISREWSPTLVSELPDAPAVFALHAGERSAYVARTARLRRRVERVVGLLRLEGYVTRLEYRLTGSALEAMLAHYSLARRIYPEDYAKRIKLRMPSYVKLILANRFPRTQVTTRLGGQRALYYGPFRSRVAAEEFEARALDLFQVRRCREDLAPRADHPGCMYGEMNLCSRPCQQVVGEQEYGSEAKRLEDFLRGDGQPLIQTIRAARERLSGDLDFEAAAREHERLERVEAVAASRDELAHDLDRLSGVAVVPGAAAGTVLLWFVNRGWWQRPAVFPLDELSGSLDRRLREIVDALSPETGGARERQEHLALLARWRYSSFAGGEWLGFEDAAKVPYRKLVNAISRVRKAVDG